MYTVACYEDCEIPEPRWLDHGTFKTAAEAMTCADHVIRRSLEALHHQNRRATPDRLYSSYLAHGEVPGIFGKPEVAFDAYAAARQHIRALTSEPVPG